jgi:polyisoprenoid-binding protein YceI
MRTTLAAVLVAVGVGLARAQPQVFEVEPEASSAEFSVNQLGVFPQHGRFGRTSGTIVLDAERRSGSFDLIVDATSVDTGWSVRDDWLRSESMFDASRYPMMRFRSTGLVFSQGKLVSVVGLLTLRDVTRQVSFKVERFQCGLGGERSRDGCGAGALATIRRSDFGMNTALGLVGDEVELSFQVTASRVQP